MLKITIPGRFPSLNDYVNACRTHPQAGAQMIKNSERQIAAFLPEPYPLQYPVQIQYRYFEPSKRRDKDNIAGVFHKIAQDTIVRAGFLPDDRWDYIDGFSDGFELDKNNPRIEITILEDGEY